MKGHSRKFGFFLLLSLCAVTRLAAADTLSKVALFTTGGTIQSKGAHRLKLSEYNDGKVARRHTLKSEFNIDSLPAQNS